MTCACCCAAVSLVPSGTGEPRMDGKHQLCEECGERLSRVKHRHRCGPGYACHPQCKQKKHLMESRTAGAAAVPLPSRKRRAASDPGESPEPAASQAITRRVVAPEPAPTSKKQYNTRREEQIMRLLDETHARRIAAEEAAGAAAGKQAVTHTGFTLAFVP
jgi:hypothetical protein